MRFKKRGGVKQLASTSVNISAFVLAILIPTAGLFSANLLQFLLRGQDLLSTHRLVALAAGLVWGVIIAWAKNVPQVLYFYRPGGRNKSQRRLFAMSLMGLLVSLSALVILGLALVSSIEDGPVITYTAALFAVIGLLPIAIGCAKPWRYIFLTDQRGVYIAYTGQVLQPNTLYRTGLTWRTPALEHHLESEESKIYQLRFKDGTFELRCDATIDFPEAPIVPDECKMDPIALYKASSDFLLRQLQAQCAKFTGMQCMKMQPGLKPVEEYIPVPAFEPEGYKIPIRMRWSGKFKLSDI
ncbi:MAG: hypothetical protein ACREAB_20350 [Blastocatellia bacterium]